MAKKSNSAYQIGITVWSAIQTLSFIIFMIMLGAADPGDSQVFVLVIGIILYFVGTIIDIKIRDIHWGNIVFRFILAALVGPFRLFAQIFTLVQMSRIGKDDEIFAKGEYKSYFLNNCWYILFNHDHEKELVSAGKKRKIEAAREENERRRKEAEAREVRRKAEVEKLKAEANSCNTKLVLYGLYESGGKYWDAKFINRNFMANNYWNKDFGTCASEGNKKNSYGETVTAYYVKSVKVDGVKINSKYFCSHLNFNLKPGRHTIEVSFYYAVSHTGWHGGSNSDYWPTNTPKDKAGVMDKTVSLTVNIEAGYRYHLGLFNQNYATYTRYYQKGSNAFLYDLRDDIHFKTFFEVMGEADVKKIADTGYVDPGVTLTQVN